MFRNKVESLRSDLSAAAAHAGVSGKPLATANEMLQPGETVRAVSKAVGQNGAGVAVLTDQRLFHVVRMLGVVKTESIRFDNVDAVETANKPVPSVEVRHGKARSTFRAVDRTFPAAVQASV